MQKHQLCDVISAWSSGKVIQFQDTSKMPFSSNAWKDWEHPPSVVIPAFNNPEIHFRIKPESRIINVRLSVGETGILCNVSNNDLYPNVWIEVDPNYKVANVGMIDQMNIRDIDY